MKRERITFLLTGLIAGLVCVMPGRSLLAIFSLTWCVGPSFFVAVVVGIVITGARHDVRAGFLRYFAGLTLCTITYLLALMVFFGVVGFSPDLFGFQQSANFEHFGIDIWLGLIAADAAAAGGIALSTTLLTGNWSNFLLLRLLLAGWVTILITFLTNLPFHTYWSFIGVLLPLGNALFCYLVGAQIWRHPEVGREIAPAVRDPRHRPA